MEFKKHENLEQKLCKELDTLEDKYRSGAELSENDLKRLDILYHTLKNMTKYEGEKEAQEYSMRSMSYENRGGYSGRNYSRDMGPVGGGYSGHYPMMQRPRYEMDWQW